MNAGYSGTPLLKKLGLKEGSSFRAIHAPQAFLDWIAEQPEPVRWAKPEETADVVVLFVEWENHLVTELPEAIQGLRMAGGLWIAWPKKAAKAPTDITENRLRDIILPMGLVDNKVCAIDEKWSGLRFVWRLDRRG